MNDYLDNRDELRVKTKVPSSALKHGSLKGKKPIQINPRTVVWVDRNATPEHVAEVVQKYTDHMDSLHYIDPSGNVIRK